MNVTIKGKGNYTLNKNDFVASGGEGSVFSKGNLAFKIYNDHSKMLPAAKIQELSVLSMPNIIRPMDILLDDKSRPIGYTMRYLKDTFALCQIFTKAFRDRYRIGNDKILNLIKELQSLVQHCHKNQILIVDLNEMNFLLDDNFKEVFAIDCDSYQTKSFRATAIMDSIRDRHATDSHGHYQPTDGTDWFSFGVLSFQMIIGIHPYKGKHSSLKTIDERMLKNVSVLHKDVSIPAICQPMGNIPSAYMAWFKAIFEDGKRVPPPGDFQAVVVLQKPVKITGSNNFLIKKLLELAEDIVRYDPAANLTLTTIGAYSDAKQKYLFPPTMSYPVVGVTPKGQNIAAHLESGQVRLHCISRGTEIGINFLADALMNYGGNIFAKAGDQIYQFDFVEPAQQIMATPQPVCPVLDKATKLFDGVVMQDLLGACYASVFPESHKCYQVHLKELDGLRIVEAKYDNGVLMVIAFKSGKYDKHIFRLSDDFSSYDIRIEADVGPVALNFVVLPTGICLHLNEKEELELLPNKQGSTKIKLFDDPALSGDMKLCRNGTQALFSKGDHLYSISVK